MINSTLAGNSANSGGGIYSTVEYGRATLKNTIVANSPTGKNCAGDAGDLTDGGGNLSYPSDGTCFGIHGDPKLGPLQNNGGPTQTMGLGPGSARWTRQSTPSVRPRRSTTSTSAAWPAPRAPTVTSGRMRNRASEGLPAAYQEIAARRARRARCPEAIWPMDWRPPEIRLGRRKAMSRL